MVEVWRPFGEQRWLRRMAVATLVMNVVIIFTGGLVRLTDSGLGCPTWPQCSPGSYTPHAELGIHGAIEFGNRLLTFVLIVVALLTWISALLHRDQHGRPDRKLRWLTFVLGLLIPFQGVIGGITVLTRLNPYVVALHMLNSMVLVALSVWLLRLCRQLTPIRVTQPVRALTVIIFALVWAVVGLGTVVTGSGPHAGDLDAVRTGIDPEIISKVHAWTVWLLVLATGAAALKLRSVAAVTLLAIELAQGVIGYVQYFTDLPIGLVATHLVGAAATMAAGANLFCSTTLRSAAGRPTDRPARSGSRSAWPRTPAENR
jgi:cytochrome c oxidase assembly protein subunit 15